MRFISNMTIQLNNEYYILWFVRFNNLLKEDTGYK